MGDGSVGYVSCHPPSPPSQAPDSLAVRFGPYGEPHFNLPWVVRGSTIFQFVPSSANPYIHSFGEGGFRDWDSPTSVYDTVCTWHEFGLEVVVHSRQPVSQVVGVSHGRARFLCGGGVSLFVARELGLLPDGVRFGEGAPLHRMVAVFGVVTPNPGLRPATYHILPAEYLVDPAVSGLPADLPLSQVYCQLPPPPLFPFLGVPNGGSPPHFSTTGQGASRREGPEKGGPFHRYLVWGALLSLHHGFH